ncbi:MAG TPA: alpha/beta fold hydrolase [Thermoleophilaceae bacterium]|jgi:triacylglycerol lipase|nr:alpha/beta fold hydrolase [Thermoleophilaceae bacterium]
MLKTRRNTFVVGLVCLALGAGAALLLPALFVPHATRSPSHKTVQPPRPTVVNSPNCKPPPQHPHPLVLVPGTFDATSWSALAPALAHQGYCVFTLEYGNRATGDIVRSAHELARFVDRLLKRTGAGKVAIVGHSEGGLMPRYYIRFLGGAGKVSDLVGLAPSNHGTNNPMALVGAWNGCTACGQQVAWGSAFLRRLNAGIETPGPVDYTSIETANDQVVLPYTSAFLSGPRARVTNITLQDRCPSDTAGHLGITTDPVALQWVDNALGRDGPANPAFAPVC